MSASTKALYKYAVPLMLMSIGLGASGWPLGDYLSGAFLGVLFTLTLFWDRIHPEPHEEEAG